MGIRWILARSQRIHILDMVLGVHIAVGQQALILHGVLDLDLLAAAALTPTISICA